MTTPEDLRTGDLVLVRERPALPRHWLLGVLDWLIETVTHSPYSHVGMVLRDPPFVEKQGLYVWESGWEGTPDPQDERVKFGVQITKWDTFVAHNRGNIFIRTRLPGDPIRLHDLVRVHAQVYMKPYDANPLDWLGAAVRHDDEPQKLDRFWCSALVAYILVQCGTLAADVDWSLVRPADLSSSSTELQWLHGYGPDEQIAAQPPS